MPGRKNFFDTAEWQFKEVPPAPSSAKVCTPCHKKFREKCSFWQLCRVFLKPTGIHFQGLLRPHLFCFGDDDIIGFWGYPSRLDEIGCYFFGKLSVG